MPFPAVHPALDRALINKGYAEPTPVQAAVLEAEHADRDLLVSAQTGSGKTVAFGLAAAPTLLGDIVLCAPVLKAEAAAQRKTIAAHCAHLLVHGALHLLGYDHLDDAEAEKMEALERQLLADMEFPDPYAERELKP